MNLETIGIITFGQFDQKLLDTVAEHVTREFMFSIKFREGHIDMSEFYEATRGQYHGNKLLKMVEEQYAHEYFKTMGLFQVDLFIPILTYIFGQAFLNGRSGISSIFRLVNERYGLKTDDRIVADRFTKEVVHELGHTFGLVHCHTPDCVMRSSTYVEDIDQKGDSFCYSCKDSIAEIQETFGFKIS